jgi:hypothetical protein
LAPTIAQLGDETWIEDSGALACHARCLLDCFPLVPANTCLTQEAGEKITANICLVRVGHTQLQYALDHDRMPRTGQWPGKAQLAQDPNQIPLANRTERRH